MVEMHAFKKMLGLAVLFTASASLPLAAGAAANVNTEIKTAASHAGFAAKAKDLKTADAHLHHALNCLVGPNGEGFDKAEANPCKNSGNGAIPDSSDPQQKMALEKVTKTLETGLSEKTAAAAKKEARVAENELKKAEVKKAAVKKKS
jgi:hypothetical protein